MNNTRYILLTILLLIIGIFSFFSFYEYYEEEIDLGWRTDALLNPFLAAEFYLADSGYDVESVDSISKINDLNSVDTLFMSDSNQVLTDSRQAEVLLWLNNGGQLIVAAPSVDAASSEKILGSFGIGIQSSDYRNRDISTLLNDDFSLEEENSSKESQKNEAVQRREFIQEVIDSANQAIEELAEQESLTEEQLRANFEQNTPTDELTHLIFTANDQPIRVHFNPAQYLTHPAIVYDPDVDPASVSHSPFYWDGSDWGNHFLQIDVGDGLLTVLSDAEIFSSSNINQFDHAYLLNNLIDEDNKTIIIFGTNMPSLIQILKEFMPEFLISFSIFVALWIWFNMARFGPVLMTQASTRRSMAEHLHASANYLWEGHFYQDLLEPLCKEIHLQASKVIPGYSEASIALKQEKLSQISGLELEKIQSALSEQDDLNEEKLLHIVQTLQRIRNSL